MFEKVVESGDSKQCTVRIELTLAKRKSAPDHVVKHKCFIYELNFKS